PGAAGAAGLMSDTPVYRLEAVSKRHGDREILRIDKLDVRSGEVLCLIGPTGAGKSTLLRLLAAVEPPTSGALAFHGRSFGAQELPLDVHRRITLVFQRPLLLAGAGRADPGYGFRPLGLAPRPHTAAP